MWGSMLGLQEVCQVGEIGRAAKVSVLPSQSTGLLKPWSRDNQAFTSFTLHSPLWATETRGLYEGLPGIADGRRFGVS